MQDQLKRQPPSLEGIPFDQFKKDGPTVTAFTQEMWAYLKSIGWTDWFVQALLEASRVEAYDALGNSDYRDGDEPSLGLVATGYEETYRPLEIYNLYEANPALFQQTVFAWLYALFLLNHPEKIAWLRQTAAQPFQAPSDKEHPVFTEAKVKYKALTIEDLVLEVGDADQRRVSRTTSFLESLGVSYWREQPNDGRTVSASRHQARSLFVVGENPDITGSAMAMASLAATHHLVGLPRDAGFRSIERQAALAGKTFEWLDHMPTLYGLPPAERAELLDWYQHNVVGTLESEPDKASARAQALYDAGVRTFKVYSPEPNLLLLETIKELRQLERDQDWEPIEIFAGQVVSVAQAQQLEEAGIDAIYIGIGGGGRCTTGKKGKLSINWVQLLWEMRGKISVPVIVQGGASDNVPTTLAAGASGIGLVGKLGGTIETPGGVQFWYDPTTGQIFKYYGGEASKRMKFMSAKVGPFGAVPYPEGETTEKPIHLDEHMGVLPTSLLAVIAEMNDAVAGFVFQNAHSISDMHEAAAHRLILASAYDPGLSNTH